MSRMSNERRCIEGKCAKLLYVVSDNRFSGDSQCCQQFKNLLTVPLDITLRARITTAKGERDRDGFLGRGLKSRQGRIVP